MSFLSIMKTIGSDALKVLGVATTVAEPIVGIALGPAASAIMTKINSAVVGAEAIIAGVSQGVAKQQSVASIVSTSLPTLDAVIAEFGAGATFDPTALNNAINASVANYNAIQALIASVKKP